MKKLVSIFLLALLPLMASAYDAQVDGIYYTLIPKGGIAMVTVSPSKYSGDIVIPSQFEYDNVTYTVTEIESRAFEYCFSLNSITLPNSVKTIGSYAFMGCRNLKTVSFGTGLQLIGERAFCMCQNLSNVYISDLAAWCNVTFELLTTNQYDSSPFFYASHLFLNGKEVKELVIPDGVTSISDHALHRCCFTSITLPSSLTSIGKNGFPLDNLISIKVAEGNSFLDSREGCNAIIETATNTLILGCKNTKIPNSVTAIGEKAFSYCSGLTSITIPNSVTSIGKGAFENCSGLTSVTILNGVTSIGGSAFSGCSCLTGMTLPNSVISIGSSSFYGCSGLKSVTIGNSVTSIEDKAFSGCSELVDVYCHAENVPSTNSNAFVDSYTEYVTLYVPEGAVAAYKSTAPWSGFGKIIALEGDEPSPTKDIAINETNFPDENFRNWILSRDRDSDGVLSEEEIAGMIDIHIGGAGIKSLQGIEFFTALTGLHCNSNKLTSLDMSKNTKLTTLVCGYNQLISLNVSGCTALTKLECYENQLTSLDVSQNTEMTWLNCASNQLGTLDVSKNTKLEELRCYSNNLTMLDLSKNTELVRLFCHNNKLVSINLSGCSALNQMTLYCNNLKENMGDVMEKIPTISNGMMRVIYNENESNVMTKSLVAAAKAKGWIPYYYDGSIWQEYAGSEPVVLRGDANGDGEIGMPDVMFVVNYILGTPDASFNTEAADANKDGEVGMPDVMYIVNYILNGKFPEE